MLNESHAIPQRMRELAVQAANDTTPTRTGKSFRRVDELIKELGRIASDTEFNTQKLLDGSFTGKIIHIGANEGQTLEITISEMTASALGVDGVDISTQPGADTAISTIDSAIATLSTNAPSSALTELPGATIANLGVSAENLQAAESRIRDVDMAQEMMNFTKFQILQQASTAMLAQANLAPQSVLQLLG